MAKAKKPKQTLINKKRATRIAKAMATNPQYNLRVEGDAAIIDVLTDLRHLCDRRGESFVILDGWAYEHYLIELSGQDSGRGQHAETT